MASEPQVTEDDFPKAVNLLEETAANQTFETSTGHTLEFAQFGPADGHPFLVMLGLGSHRYFCKLYEDEAYVHHLNLICVDRPNYRILSIDGKVDTPDKEELQHRLPKGRDEMNESTRLKTEWFSKAMAEVLDHLKVTRKVGIMAQSCGSIYALNFANKYPEKIEAIYLVSPFVPLDFKGSSGTLKFYSKLPHPVTRPGIHLSVKFFSSEFLARRAPKYLLKQMEKEVSGGGLAPGIGTRSSSHTIKPKRGGIKPKIDFQKSSDRALDAGIDELHVYTDLEYDYMGQTFLKNAREKRYISYKEDMHLCLHLRELSDVVAVFEKIDPSLNLSVFHGTRDKMVPLDAIRTFVDRNSNSASDKDVIQLFVINKATHNLIMNLYIIAEVFTDYECRFKPPPVPSEPSVIPSMSPDAVAE